MTTRASLDDFIAAQAPVWPDVLAELAAGSKRSHWMWFVFPQLAGLGRSSTARFFALDDIAAARSYAAHPLLGARLREAVRSLLRHEGRAAETMLGPVDTLKLRSCLTLFAVAAPDEALFPRALAAFFDGPDEATLALLA